MILGLERLPDRIGEGGIFAFSGMDGPTHTASRFVGTWGERLPDLLFHTPRRRKLSVGLPADFSVAYVTGDVCSWAGAAGALTLAYTHWHTLAGEACEGCSIALGFAEEAAAAAAGAETEAAPGLTLTRDPQAGDWVVLARQEHRFAVSFGVSREEAVARAQAGMSVSMEETVAERVASCLRLPKLPDPALDRLLQKCVSVMKVNTLAAEAGMKQHWSTPDRVPHRDMWLWDTVFHSLAMNALDPELSCQCLFTMLEAQQEDGMIPHQISVSGRRSSITQPPILAWGMWENFRHLGKPEALAYALPYLERYLEWSLQHRDVNGNGLLEWAIAGDVMCRSGESGMDNSSRFDKGVKVDAVDFNVFMARDMYYLSLICRELEQEEKAAFWARHAEELSQRIQTRLWSETDKFYYDLEPEGGLSPVKAVSGFLPLLLDNLPEQHTEGLVRMLKDPLHFLTPCPVPSIAVSQPEWGTDMWRGPTWINMNVFIILGLRKQGRREEAEWLKQRTIGLVQKYYLKYGVVFEYYDSTDRVDPVDCDRKGPRRKPYDIRVKTDSIRDYHWTAALTALLLLEEDTN
ncbi:amylo-alpha-1,6-glucosidase [Paenibacillus mesotrionivorans]|uniref:Amylo-alpha-1,6-glucosidase n=1 Tax=Paenibacillus mesotrionivorans TaxID=3160968 RepID=A0ACC7NTL5_9BACL